MCLIAFAWKYRPDFPLVVAANRDEFLDRPTAPADIWPDAPDLVAGRDLVGGGTWMGVTRGGRFAAVTNFRDPSEIRPGTPSRGHLVRDYLLGDDSLETYLSVLAEKAEAYQGFNLLVGDGRSLIYFGSRDRKAVSLHSGIYALSNASLNASWPKTERARRALATVMDSDSPDADPLFALLADRRRPRDEELPDTGVGVEWERILSSAFIVAPGYGTRSSSILRFARGGELDFRERTFAEGGTKLLERHFTLPSPF